MNAPAGGSPTEPITVTATGGTLQSVVAALPNGVQLNGAFGAGKTSWKTTTGLAFGKSYAVTVKATNPTGQVTSMTKTVSTATPSAYAFPSFVPAASATNIGVGQPIRVQFMQSPADTKPIPVSDHAAIQKLLTVTSSPAQPGAWYWITSNTVDYRPQNFWKPGTTITLHANIEGASFGKGAYGEKDRTATYRVHDSWVAKADGNAHQMMIYHNDQYVKTMNVSLGSTQYPTHVGTHVISAKANPYTMNSCTFGLCPPAKGAYISKEYYANRISNDGEFVHENPKSILAQGHSNVSHGCINLNPTDAQWFYSHFGVGDVVEVTHSGGKQLPLDDLWGDWSVDWSAWKAGNTHP